MSDPAPEKPLRTLGLDLSSTRSGAAAYEDRELLWTAAWQRPGRARDPFQLWMLADFESWLESLVEWGPNPERAVPEPPFDRAMLEYDMVQRGGKTIRLLGRFEGIGLAVCFRHNMDCRDSTPSHLRKVALGNGGLSKEQAAAEVRGLFPGHKWSLHKGLDEEDATVAAMAAAVDPDW